jgi:hypothetical protein
MKSRRKLRALHTIRDFQGRGAARQRLECLPAHPQWGVRLALKLARIRGVERRVEVRANLRSLLLGSGEVRANSRSLLPDGGSCLERTYVRCYWAVAQGKREGEVPPEPWNLWINKLADKPLIRYTACI